MTGLREIEVREAPEPKMEGPEDVLVRIDTIGVCGSDVHYYTAGKIGSQKVQYPQTVGHECSGTIVEIGPGVTRLKPGQRVAVEPAISCGNCDQCLAGRPHTCRNLKFMGCPGQAPGVISELMVMPSECCFPIPDSMSLVQAAVAEPLSIGVYAQKLAAMPDNVKVAVLGTGPIGLCTILSCRAGGECTVYAADLLENRLETAVKCGADWTGRPPHDDIVSEIKKLEPLGIDYVFECAGEQETLDQAIELLKPGGTLVMVGIPEVDRVSFSIDDLRRKELRLQNVRRQNDCLGVAVDLIASEAVDVMPLVTHHFPVDEIKDAFEMVAGYKDGIIKGMIHMNEITE